MFERRIRKIANQFKKSPEEIQTLKEFVKAAITLSVSDHAKKRAKERLWYNTVEQIINDISWRMYVLHYEKWNIKLKYYWFILIIN